MNVLQGTIEGGVEKMQKLSLPGVEIVPKPRQKCLLRAISNLVLSDVAKGCVFTIIASKYLSKI